MKIIICLDQNNGISFNNRRQSQDKKVIMDVKEILGDKELLVSEYSVSLFTSFDIPIKKCSNLLEEANDTDYVFVESIDVNQYTENINELIIYRWNRSYPFDTTFNIDLSEFSLVSQTDFIGSSHKRITKEIYVKKNVKVQL